jgi:hypothetical protein
MNTLHYLNQQLNKILGTIVSSHYNESQPKLVK